MTDKQKETVGKVVKVVFDVIKIVLLALGVAL